jgi:hypothetical protein
MGLLRFYFTIFCSFPFLCFSQWKTVTVTVSGKTANIWVFRPPDSATSVPGGKPAVSVHWPGTGESTTDTNKIYVHGPAPYVRDSGWRPNRFLVVVQPPSAPADYTFVRVMMNFLFRGANAFVKGADTTRIGINGISYGADNNY